MAKNHQPEKGKPRNKPSNKQTPPANVAGSPSPLLVTARENGNHKALYRKELGKLQIELVKLQQWVRYKGLKVVVLFEGRDAAGKGGAIKLAE